MCGALVLLLLVLLREDGEGSGWPGRLDMSRNKVVGPEFGVEELLVVTHRGCSAPGQDPGRRMWDAGFPFEGPRPPLPPPQSWRERDG